MGSRGRRLERDVEVRGRGRRGVGGVGEVEVRGGRWEREAGGELEKKVGEGGGGDGEERI